jgi:hypothetical protein
MSRLLKVVPGTLALVALSVFVASCGSNSPAKVRFVQAIQDADPLDVDVSNTNEVNTTQTFPDISFLGVQPNQPGYTSVPSGSVTIAGFLTGTTTQVFSNTLGLSSGAQYTEIATGFSQPPSTNGSNVVLLSILDFIPTPPTADVGFRVIHASPSGPGTVDVYILQNPSAGPIGAPVFSALAYTQGSSYVFLPFNPNNDINPPGFTVYVTTAGGVNPIITESITPATAGAVRTLVLTDVQGGTTMSTSFLELSDLN